MLASSVDRDVNSGPVGQNWLRQWFQTLNLSFTFTFSQGEAIRMIRSKHAMIFSSSTSSAIHWSLKRQTKHLVHYLQYGPIFSEATPQTVKLIKSPPPPPHSTLQLFNWQHLEADSIFGRIQPECTTCPGIYRAIWQQVVDIFSPPISSCGKLWLLNTITKYGNDTYFTINDLWMNRNDGGRFPFTKLSVEHHLTILSQTQPTSVKINQNHIPYWNPCFSTHWILRRKGFLLSCCPMGSFQPNNNYNILRIKGKFVFFPFRVLLCHMAISPKGGSTDVARGLAAGHTFFQPGLFSKLKRV